jgi:hypothetical protein
MTLPTTEILVYTLALFTVTHTHTSGAAAAAAASFVASSTSPAKHSRNKRNPTHKMASSSDAEIPIQNILFVECGTWKIV